MTAHTELKRTPLYEKHRSSKARMVEFGGWDMPVQYQGLIAEHLAVRQAVGVFDVSHMGQFIFTGPDALTFLQFATSNSLAKLPIGRAQYNMLPNSSGGLVDDIYIYHLESEKYLMVVNASNIDKDFTHLKNLLISKELPEPFKVALENKSDDYALLAVQGPHTRAVLDPFCSVDLNAVKKNDVLPATLFDLEVLLACTGYTGEDGFEIFCTPEQAPIIWDHLLEQNITPCGLGSRDTLRLEAGFPLYGHEFSETLNPLETHMAWAIKMHKSFFGKEALVSLEIKHKLIGLKLGSKGIPREGYEVYCGGKKVGYISSGTMSPSLKCGIAMAFVEKDVAILGSSLQIKIREQMFDARVVEPVFLEK